MVTNLSKRIARLLRWSEKYTKTDMLYLVRGNFWLLVNKSLSVGNGLALSVAFAYFISKEEFGTYAFVLAILSVVGTPITSALGAGITKSVARGEHRTIFEGLRWILPWSMGGAALLACGGTYYLMMGNIVLGGTLLLGALVLPVSVANGIAKSFFVAKGDYEIPTKFNLWRTPLTTAILILVTLLTKSALWILVVYILINTLFGFLLYVTLKQKYNLHAYTKEDISFNKKYAFHSFIFSIFGTLSEKIDSILLWKFLGAGPVAIYTYALAPIRELRGLFEQSSLLALPKFAQKEFSEVKRILPLRIGQMYIVVIPVMFLYIFTAPFLFSILFPQYTDAVILSQFAALSLLSMPRRFIGAAISAHQKIKESYIMIVAPNILRIVLAFAFIPAFGLSGALIALLTAEIIEYFILGYLTWSYKGKIEKSLPLEKNATDDINDEKS